MSTPKLGFFQALGVLIYCSLIGALMWGLETFFKTPPQFLAISFVLLLLVLSAAVTGTLIFGYPAYLVFNKKVKKALTLVGFTLLYLMGIISTIIIILALF